MSIESGIDFGLVKIAAASPKVHLANVPANVREIGEAMNRAAAQGAAIAVFPELSLTGYSCGDLFFQSELLTEVEKGLAALAKLTTSLDITAIVGAPVCIRQRIYDCAVVLSGGMICGLVPKSHLPNTQELSERRWFAPASELPVSEIEIGGTGKSVPVGADLIFENKFFKKLSFGIEISEDLCVAEPPSGKLALAGAALIFNLSASNAVVGKTRFRRESVKMQSARCRAAYVYAGAGAGESTTDVVFGGECFIAQNGEMLAESKSFAAETELVFAQTDVDLLANRRRTDAEFLASEFAGTRKDFRRVHFVLSSTHTDFGANVFGKISNSPFVPADASERRDVSREAFEIQVAGLARRLAHTHAKNVVLGISGGWDSTLAILVVKEAFARLGLDAAGIRGYSLPGPGTSERTRKNALDLMTRLGIEAKEISIVPAVEQHLSDINHPRDCYDAAFENAQARERTQILMDLANRCGGFVVGTGDMSEAALGWCTFNGDQMSMYHVNIGVPKTLIRHIIAWVAEEKGDAAIAQTLQDIIDTPISPELKPPSESGEIAQKTEDLVGPYELHDFFLYHFCGNAFAPKKILLLAENAFAGTYDRETICKWLKIFLRRFFSQQFKRSACPDGPKVLEIGLSPRGDWRMPSDAESAMWLSSLGG
ncbi:MAG: NAD(+) synthase [Opitutales bacterium]|nr:NAD(+) synthase [Opitutales bacterium]